MGSEEMEDNSSEEMPSEDDSSEDDSSEDDSEDDSVSENDDTELDETSAKKTSETSETSAKKKKAETSAKKKDHRHTMAAPHYNKPVEYSPVPVGDAAREADAHLASGADADRKEDWAVHKATHKALHPSAAQKKAAKKKKKMKQPKPLKEARRAYQHGIATIAQTKAIIRTPLVKLTLKEAKENCGKIRKQVEKKCKSDKTETHYFCLREGTKEEDCEKRKMRNAAECKVAHETAYNSCFSLWKRAKKNVQEERAEAAAPMETTDTDVKQMDKGATKCASLQTKASAKCTKTMASYQSKCKKKMAEALEMSFTELPTILLQVQKDKKAVKKAAVKTAKKKASHKHTKEAAKVAAASKHALKKAE